MMPTVAYLKLMLAVFFFLGEVQKIRTGKIIAQAPPYQPVNLYPGERLPTYFNRVAVMPAFCDTSSSTALSFIDDLILQELSKSRLFEPARVTPQESFSLFGKERLGSFESLPEDFDQLVNKYGANGVLMVDIHSYRPYRPISLESGQN